VKSVGLNQRHPYMNRVMVRYRPPICRLLIWLAWCSQRADFCSTELIFYGSTIKKIARRNFYSTLLYENTVIFSKSG